MGQQATLGRVGLGPLASWALTREQSAPLLQPSFVRRWKAQQAGKLGAPALKPPLCLQSAAGSAGFGLASATHLQVRAAIWHARNSPRNKLLARCGTHTSNGRSSAQPRSAKMQSLRQVARKRPNLGTAICCSWGERPV